MARRKTDNDLAEFDKLSARLQEAEDALLAIRTGQVDALLIHSPAGEQVYTLQGADHPTGLWSRP